MDEKLKKILNGTGLALLFVISFCFFLYFSFPYGVLKEAITAEVNKSSPFNFRIEKFGPSFPLGFSATGVGVASKTSNRRLEIQSVSVDVSLLSLLIGRLGTAISVTSKTGGKLNLGLRIGIFSAIKGNYLPSRITLDANNFAIDDYTAFGMSLLANDASMNPMVAPLLSQIGIKGALNGKVDIDLDTSEATQSKGSIELGLAKAELTIDDPSLDIGEQKFDKFIVRANMDKGKLVIDDKSGLKSQGIILELNGKVDLKEAISASLLNLNLVLKLDKQLKDNFGFIVDAAMGGQNGEAKMQILGTIAQPRTVAM
jgi:type II secretion system protein N